MIRVFLVEDEPPSLRKLERLVGTQEDLSICGTANTCALAIAGIRNSNPELIILDIRLPDGSAFEVLQEIDDMNGLQVIFLTAFDQYALDAFHVAALDYLVKPVAQERFALAIQRARDRLAVSDERPKARYLKRFLVERRKVAYLLPVESVHWISADRNYALLYSLQGEFALRTTMDALQQRLDPSEFARVSRSAIVRVSAIRELRSRGDGAYVAILPPGIEVTCSRNYWTAALDRFL